MIIGDARGGASRRYGRPLTAFVVALSLVVQLIAMPYQQALAGPALAGSDTSAIVSDLKAVFGDAAGFCAHAGDKGAPAPHGPCNHCDDQCPLCRSVAEATTFRPARRPDFAGTPRRSPATPSAPRPISAPFPPARLSATAPARLPSPSEDRSPRAPFGARMSLFRLEVYLPCRSIRIGSPVAALSGAVAVLWLTPAYPHAVCGARIFPATLAIDDPGVLDELTLPTVSWVPNNSDGAHEWDASFSWTKTITPGLSVVDRLRTDLGAPGRLRLERA